MKLQSMAEKHGEVVDQRCVNASYGPGSIPMNIQFLTEGDEGQAACIDPHFSIEVEVTKKDEIKAMNLIHS